MVFPVLSEPQIVARPSGSTAPTVDIGTSSNVDDINRQSNTPPIPREHSFDEL
jgi:hypothetical protein